MRFSTFASGDDCELYVSIREVEPAIWRRLRVPAELTLAELHDVLQVAFGWLNYHLHDFAGGLRWRVRIRANAADPRGPEPRRIPGHQAMGRPQLRS